MPPIHASFDDMAGSKPPSRPMFTGQQGEHLQTIDHRQHAPTPIPNLRKSLTSIKDNTLSSLERRRVACQVHREPNNFVRPSAAPQRELFGALVECLHVPGLLRKSVRGLRDVRWMSELTVEMSVRKGPATMQFARTLGPKELARDMVRLLRPAFAAASENHKI